MITQKIPLKKFAPQEQTQIILALVGTEGLQDIQAIQRLDSKSEPIDGILPEFRMTCHLLWKAIKDTKRQMEKTLEVNPE